MKVCVIGAGASGLVTAKYCLEDSDISHVTVFELGSRIGGTFVNKVYDDTALVSSTTLTAFSDFRFKDPKARHVTAVDYVEYLNQYADHFNLNPHIKFQTKVMNITKCNEKDQYMVHWVNVRTNEIIIESFDAVAVCSGLHNVPWRPSSIDILNLETFQGEIIHSSDYKNSNMLRNKNVLIVGCGETAMDIAYRAAKTLDGTDKTVAMIVREGILSIPHYMGNKDRPLDVFITNIFEHAYEHPWVNRHYIRWRLSTFVIRFFLLLLGSSWGANQWVYPLKDIKRGYHILNKSHAAIPHLNAYVKRQYGFIGKFSMWLFGESSLKQIRPYGGGGNKGIKEIEKDTKTIIFDGGEKYENCDLIVFCTGYRQSFPFIDKSILYSDSNTSTTSTGCNQMINPCYSQCHSTNTSDRVYRHANGEDPLPTEHFITSPHHPKLAFIGFVRPNVGAIPPMSEVQVMWWLQRMKNKINAANSEDYSRCDQQSSYLLRGKKYQYGVDYGNYMHRVCEDFGAAPLLSSLWKRSMRSFFAYTQGQACVPFFRLDGPYKSEKCWSIAENELYAVCRDRGILENLGLGIMNAVFLGVNISAYVIEGIYSITFGFIHGYKFRGFSRYA
jgi:dimethylaniline monooxygenase (N-oxide forming)